MITSFAAGASNVTSSGNAQVLSVTPANGLTTVGSFYGFGPAAGTYGLEYQARDICGRVRPASATVTVRCNNPPGESWDHAQAVGPLFRVPSCSPFKFALTLLHPCAVVLCLGQ